MSLTFIFYVKKAVSALLIPPALPLLLTAAGLLLLKKRPRTGKALAWSGVLLGLFLSTLFGTEILTKPLESHPPITPKALSEVQAIVILGGGQRRVNEELNGPTVNRLTLERLRYGARLARQTTLPILVTGGAPTGFVAEGILMAETLKTDFGVASEWIEASALDTADNATFSARILSSVGITRIALVTHAAHMRRAVAEFEAHGMKVSAAPMSFMSGGPRGEDFFDYTPNMSSAYTGWYAMHEWIGIAAQKIRFALK